MHLAESQLNEPKKNLQLKSYFHYFNSKMVLVVVVLFYFVVLFWFCLVATIVVKVISLPTVKFISQR